MRRIEYQLSKLEGDFFGAAESIALFGEQRVSHLDNLANYESNRAEL